MCFPWFWKRESCIAGSLGLLELSLGQVFSQKENPLG